MVREVFQEVGVARNDQGGMWDGQDLPAFLARSEANMNPPLPFCLQYLFCARGSVGQKDDHTPKNFEHAQVWGMVVSAEVRSDSRRKGAGRKAVTDECNPWKGEGPPRLGKGHVGMDRADHLCEGTVHAFRDAVLLRVVRDGALKVDAAVCKIRLETRCGKLTHISTMDGFDGGIKVTLSVGKPCLDGSGNVTVMGKSKRPQVTAPIIN